MKRCIFAVTTQFKKPANRAMTFLPLGFVIAYFISNLLSTKQIHALAAIEFVAYRNPYL